MQFFRLILVHLFFNVILTQDESKIEYHYDILCEDCGDFESTGYSFEDWEKNGSAQDQNSTKFLSYNSEDRNNFQNDLIARNSTKNYDKNQALKNANNSNFDTKENCQVVGVVLIATVAFILLIAFLIWMRAKYCKTNRQTPKRPIKNHRQKHLLLI
jgi:hypothetical protein